MNQNSISFYTLMRKKTDVLQCKSQFNKVINLCDWFETKIRIRRSWCKMGTSTRDSWDKIAKQSLHCFVTKNNEKEQKDTYLAYMYVMKNLSEISV